MSVLAELDDVLTVADVAGALKCSEDSVYRLVADKKIRTFIIGKKGVRVTKAALLEYVGLS